MNRLFHGIESYKILQALSILSLGLAWGLLYTEEFSTNKKLLEHWPFALLTLGIVLIGASLFVGDDYIKTVRKDG